MKRFSIILVSLAMAAVSVTAAADEPIMAECFPHTAAADKMSIGVVYLHGWFSPNNRPDESGYRSLERANRAYLEQLAIRYNIRIALPLGVLGAKGWIHWDELTHEEIEARARRACNGAPLKVGRVMIGFSNGAIKAGRECQDSGEYSRYLVLGKPKGVSIPRCGRAVIHADHHAFPYSEIPAALASLGEAKTADADTADQDSGTPVTN